MRLFPFVWLVLSIVFGFAVLIATWVDTIVQMSWFDDSQYAFPDGLAVWPDPILAVVGLALIIGGSSAIAVVVGRMTSPTSRQAGIQVPERGWPRIWIMSTIGLGAGVLVMPILEAIALDNFYYKHAILDGAPFGPQVILGCLGVILTVGGILATLVAHGRPRAGSLVIKPLAV